VPKKKGTPDTISFHGTPPEKKIYCEKRFESLTAAKRSHWWNVVTDFWIANGAPALVYGEEFVDPPAVVVSKAKANWRHHTDGLSTQQSAIARMLQERARAAAQEKSNRADKK
jgi:hypothetical protein